MFTSPATSYDKPADKLDVRGLSKEASFKKFVAERVEASHPLFTCPRLDRGYTELFLDSDRAEADSPIFKALTTAVKATLAAREAKFAGGRTSICFYYPVVVLDGMLWEAFLEGAAVDAIEQQVVVVSYFYESPNYPHEGFRVPIVAEAALPAFLDKLEGVLSELSDYFHATPEAFGE